MKIYSTPFEFFLIAVYSNTQDVDAKRSWSTPYISNIFIYFLLDLLAFGMDIAKLLIFVLKNLGIFGNAFHLSVFDRRQSAVLFSKNEAKVASYNKLNNYEI